MEKYNYVEAVKENVRSYIRDNIKILEYISRDEKEEIIGNGVLTEYMNPLLVQANKSSQTLKIGQPKNICVTILICYSRQ